MKQAFSLPFRQVHLDFHTGPAIGDVGSKFDAKAFARTFRQAHVNSVTVFAKCHHGHLYYNTRHPARHPGLKKGLDLLRRQVDALHDAGIRAPIYLSVQCDEFAANTHPEWIARNPDGTNVGQKPLEKPLRNFNWQILDMSSPYQDYLAQQTEEVLELFDPVDGLFFDMCWDQMSVSKWALAGMKKQGMNAESEEERKAYAHTVALGYMKRLYQMAKSANREASCYFNSRPLSNLAEEVPFLTQVEIEALPTGGWGYMYFPKNVRFARTFGRPYLGMTARFHKSWADFGGLKPYAALEYETSQMMAHGAQCSIGDQLHPRGFLDTATYDLIGKAYKRVAEREEWLGGAKPVAQIGLFQATTAYANAAADDGATRMLTQLKHQFDVVNHLSELSHYDLVILPDGVRVDEVLGKKLRAYLKNGGKALLTGTSGLSADCKAVLLPETGIAAGGESGYQTTYIRFDKAIGQDVPAADHVIYERSVQVTARRGTQILARVVHPYFDRTWEHFSSHCQTPYDKVSRYAAATLRGGVAYIAYPIFTAFSKHGNYPYRLLVRNVLRQLLPSALLEVEAPTSTETSVMRQGKRTIVHLLQYCPERRAEGLDLIEDIVPLYDVKMSLACAKGPLHVYLAPERTELPFTFAHGRCHVTVPKVAGHAMVVFE